MTIEYLKYFVTTYKLGSIYKAAKQLYISPQGVSRGIRKLEEELDQSLFDRTQSGLQPTAFSDMIFARAEKLVDEFEMLESIAKNYSNSGNGLRMGLLGYNAISDSMHIAAEAFSKQESGCDISLETFRANDFEAMYKKLDSGELDLAWAFHTEEDPQYRYFPIMRNAVHFAVGANHPLAAKEPLQWTDIKDQPVITAADGELFPTLLDRHCQKHGFQLDVRYHSLDSGYIAALISRGEAIGPYFFEYIGRLKTIDPTLVFKLTTPPLYMSASVIFRADNKNAQVAAAAEFLVRHFDARKN